ncbi:uncharacterized protein HKW66_Vig0202000 [Vigna angularis]|uniref:Uncharacterized protein n=1 Tax=Phaseolus angularis TaxID=3914 RepID=A0A8T0JUH3_PHAAN|nr:uncharacterized protein HKW66_Vig0202000 [Vigna angularis]
MWGPKRGKGRRRVCFGTYVEEVKFPPTLPDYAASSTQSSLQTPPFPLLLLHHSDSILHNLQPYGGDNTPNTAIQTPTKNQPERDTLTIPTSEIQPEQVQLQPLPPSFRPLYVVLVSNATIVIAKLFFGVQRDYARMRRSGSSGDDEDEYSQLAKMLELCLVAKIVVDVVFMDCFMYTILLICGLSVIKA